MCRVIRGCRNLLVKVEEKQYLHSFKVPPPTLIKEKLIIVQLYLNRVIKVNIPRNEGKSCQGPPAMMD